MRLRKTSQQKTTNNPSKPKHRKFIMTYYINIALKIVLYILQFAASAVLALIAIFFGWFIALFVDKNTGNLPHFLRWFQTVDATCYDEMWVAEHPDWSKHKIARTWIARNPAYGFNKKCGINVSADTQLRVSGDLDIADGEFGKAGFFFIAAPDGHWNYSYVVDLKNGNCIRGEMGWYLLPLAKKYESVNTGMLQASPFRFYAFGKKGN